MKKPIARDSVDWTMFPPNMLAVGGPRFTGSLGLCILAVIHEFGEEVVALGPLFMSGFPGL